MVFGIRWLMRKNAPIAIYVKSDAKRYVTVHFSKGILSIVTFLTPLGTKIKTIRLCKLFVGLCNKQTTME